MQIQISWLLQKPTDLDLHCLLRQGMSCFAREGLTLKAPVTTATDLIMMIWCFTSLSTLLKPYWDDEGMIMKSSVQWSTVQSWAEFRPIVGFKARTLWTEAMIVHCSSQMLCSCYCWPWPRVHYHCHSWPYHCWPWHIVHYSSHCWPFMQCTIATIVDHDTQCIIQCSSHFSPWHTVHYSSHYWPWHTVHYSCNC